MEALPRREASITGRSKISAWRFRIEQCSVLKLSNKEYCFFAEITPVEIPNESENIIAIMDSFMVTQYRCSNNSETGDLVNREIPGSPLLSLVMKSRYWIARGLFKP